MRRWAGWLGVAIVAGLITGALTLAGQAILPTDANRLANSGAIWVTVAFALGWRVPTDGMAATTGFLSLVAALAGYFTAAAVAHAGISVSTVAIWLGVAIIGGPVFGVAGRWRATGDARRAVIGIALLGAVYVAEGIATLLSIPHMQAAGWVSVVAGIVLVVALSRDRAERLRACVALVPLTILGIGGYAAVDLLFRSV
jgi:hypothetical protein